MSKGISLLKNDHSNQNLMLNSQAPFQNQQSNGISFSQEFENLLKYIAVTAGNTNMPQGIKPMTYRPGNLPPKTQEEEKMH